MIAKQKKPMLLLLAVLLIFSTFVTASSQEIVKPGVYFIVNEPDSSGLFTADVKISNATFMGIQAGLSFDPDVVQLVDFENAKEPDKFEQIRVLHPFEGEKNTYIFNEIGCSFSNEDGLLKFTAYLMPDAKGMVTVIAEEEGFVLYQFRFKRLKSEDPKFDLLDYNDASYEKELLLTGGEDLGIDFQIDVPESFAKKTDKVSYNFGTGRNKVPAPELTVKQKRDARTKDTIILNINNYAAVIDGQLNFIDSNNKNVYPYIENDRTYVPLRFISESMGANVFWNPETAVITISMGDTEIVMAIGEKSYSVNGETKEMDVTPLIKEDRTFVPIYFVSEALGKDVYWNASSRVVIVTPADRPWDETSDIEKSLLSDSLLIMSPLVRDLVSE